MSEATTYTATQAALNEYMSARVYALSLYRRSPVDLAEPVYVKLGGQEFSSGHTEPLEEFLAGLHKAVAGAPDDAEIMIRIESGYGYDDERGDPEYEVGYWRKPTAEERAARERQNRDIAEHNRLCDERDAEKERAEFERLKGKFERDSDTRPKDGDAKQGSTRE